MGREDLSSQARVEDFITEARKLIERFGAAEPEALQLVRRYHPSLPGRADTNDRNQITKAQLSNLKLSPRHARHIIAKSHSFESWEEFIRHIKARSRRGSAVWQFETAVDAIITGDLKTLRQLLKENPRLVRARSSREHHATLLHYVSANGVEGYHQRSPKNAVEITKVLLKAGAEVDADLAYGPTMRKAYPERRGSTTLGLAATSYHPAAAGVQLKLLDLLLAAGASIDGIKPGWNPLIAALHNGRGQAAEFLAKKGAALDLEGAAGTGLLREVKKYVTESGELQKGATVEQLKYGFTWACEYGHSNVVEYLLEAGLDPNTVGPHHGQTGLHWAGYGGHAQTVMVLLKHGAGINPLDKSFKATPLGWAVYGWANRPPESRKARYVDAIEALVDAGGTVERKWLQQVLEREQLERLGKEPRTADILKAFL